jgi:hypothetical protein
MLTFKWKTIRFSLEKLVNMKLSRIQYIELAALRIILNDNEDRMLELWNTITDSAYQKTHHPIELYLNTSHYPERISLSMKIVLQSKNRGITWVEGMLNHLFISGKFNRRFDAADVGVTVSSLMKVLEQIKEKLAPVVELNLAEGSRHVFVSATSRTLPVLLQEYADKTDQTFGKLHKLNLKKHTSEAYYADDYGSDNWFRKISVDPDEVERFTAGKVFMTMPVHLLPGNPICLDPSKKERERIYVVEGSPKPYRRFDGTKRKHCSRCPFEDGCMVCTLK